MEKNIESSNNVGFWEEGYEVPIELRLWYEIPGYNKFRSILEMEDSDAFFALLLCNAELRNTKSFKELQYMSKKYAIECITAAESAKKKNNEKYCKDLIQRGFTPVIDRTAGMYKEEVETFMEYVHQAEWLQYIEQTAEEIHQVLLSKASSGKPITYF